MPLLCTLLLPLLGTLQSLSSFICCQLQLIHCLSLFNALPFRTRTSGGDLVDRQRIRTELDAANVVRAIVDGIRYCHDHHIAVSRCH